MLKPLSDLLNDWEFYTWPQTSQSKEEMGHYQTGKIDKEEHEKQRRVIFEEELAIYKKARKDTVGQVAGWGMGRCDTVGHVRYGWARMNCPSCMIKFWQELKKLAEEK